MFEIFLFIFIFSMMSAVIALAESIAVMSPVAVQGTKINLNYARDHSVEEGLDFVVSIQIGIQDSQCSKIWISCPHWRVSFV